MRTQTKQTQDNLTPQDAHRILEEGNIRFQQNLKMQRNLKEQVLETSTGQFPFAAILSCIDSRVPAEIVFDQGIGDIFSIRIAGNIINTDILGSMEYACKVAGSKIILVLGHTKCGAVTSACNHVELGNVTHLLDKIQPAVKVVGMMDEKVEEEVLVEQVSVQNVLNSIDLIRGQSPILNEMEQQGEIEIVAAMYHVETGEVVFL